MSEHELQDASRLGPERHSHADLTRALGDRERHHAVQSDDRKRERRKAEHHEQRAERAEEPRVQLVLLFERTHPVERQRRIDLVDLGLNRRRVRHRIALGSHDQAHEVDHVLGERQIHALIVHVELRERAAEVHVGHHADDVPPRRRVVAQPNPSTDRIAAAEESLHEPLVDDRDRKTPVAIRVGERSSGDRLHIEHIEVARPDHDAPGARMILVRRIRRAVD